MNNIKKTLKQLDLIPLPEKERILPFYGEYENIGNKPQNRFTVQLIPLYSALALVMITAIGFAVFNRDNLFTKKMPPDSDIVTDYGVSPVEFGIDVTVESPHANAKITLEAAEQIAVEKVGGGDVTESKYDKKNGVLICEIEVLFNGIEYDVDIDAMTGKILDVEKDD